MIKKLNLIGFHILEPSEMKQITGGRQQCDAYTFCPENEICVSLYEYNGVVFLWGCSATGCSTTCPNGTYLEITDCNGRCEAGSDYVKCYGSTQTLEKRCN